MNIPYDTPRRFSTSRPWRKSHFLSLVALLLAGASLWTVHTAIQARSEGDQPALEAVRQELAATRSELADLRTSLGEQASEVRAMQIGELHRTEGVVDFWRPGAQLIGQGFAVTRLTTEETPQGHRVAGWVINTQAVRHRDLLFRVTAEETSAEFLVPRIEAGESAPFSIHFYRTEEAAEMPRFVRFEYLESIIGHRMRPSEALGHEGERSEPARPSAP